jgi:cold-inducible RNA-binding protein
VHSRKPNGPTWSDPTEDKDWQATETRSRRLPLVSIEELMPAMMIYVGNLDYATTSEELRTLFEPFGAVAMAEVQVKARTGQSRGFGLVDMPRQSEAEAAIAALNNREFKDRALTVNESRPRRTVRDLYAGGGWFGGGHGG